MGFCGFQAPRRRGWAGSEHTHSQSCPQASSSSPAHNHQGAFKFVHPDEGYGRGLDGTNHQRTESSHHKVPVQTDEVVPV